MKDKKLIERYIFAVSRYLPQKTREETSKELASLIDEMLLERCGANPYTDDDIEAVLIKLGSPESLALKYLGKENIAFISGTSVLLYQKLLKLVLPIVFGAVVFGFVLAYLLGGETGVFSSLWGGIIISLCMAFTAITISVAIFDSAKDKSKADFISSLPHSTSQKQHIPLYEPIIHIVLSIVFATFLLGFSDLLAGKPEDASDWIPFFVAAELRSMWYLIIAATLITIAVEVFKIIEKKHTLRLSIISFIANLASLVLMILVLSNRQIISQEFLQSVASIEEAGEAGSKVLKNLNYIIIVGIVAADVAQSVSAIVRAVSASRDKAQKMPNHTQN